MKPAPDEVSARNLAGVAAALSGHAPPTTQDELNALLVPVAQEIRNQCEAVLPLRDGRHKWLKKYFVGDDYWHKVVTLVDTGQLSPKFDKPEFLALVRINKSLRGDVTPQCVTDAIGEQPADTQQKVRIKSFEELELWFDVGGLRLRRKGAAKYPLFEWDGNLGLRGCMKVQNIFRDLCLNAQSGLRGIMNEKTGAWRQLVFRANEALRRVVTLDGDAITSEGIMTKAAFKVVPYIPPEPRNPHGTVSFDNAAVGNRLATHKGKVITGDRYRPPKE